MSVQDVCLYTQWIASANATPDVSDDKIRPRRTRLLRRSLAITVTQYPSRPATHGLLGDAGHPSPTSVTTATPGGTQDLPAPVLAHLGLGDTFRDALSTDGYGRRRRPDLGGDWISSRDLRLLYVDGRISLLSGTDRPPARRVAPRAAHAVGYRPRGVSPAAPPESARSRGSALSQLSRPPPLRPHRRLHVPRRSRPFHADLAALESTQRQAARARQRLGLPPEPQAACRVWPHLARRRISP